MVKFSDVSNKAFGRRYERFSNDPSRLRQKVMAKWNSFINQ